MQTIQMIMESNGLNSNSTRTPNRLGCRFLPLERYQYRSFLRMDPSPLSFPSSPHNNHIALCRDIFGIVWWRVDQSEWAALYTLFVNGLVYKFQDYFVCWHYFILVESQHQHFSTLEFKQFIPLSNTHNYHTIWHDRHHDCWHLGQKLWLYT